ncbi:MAG: DUF1549 domain-containing protein [Gemmataceae bacterium]|nr:DUF1549 domain-containing protein [Gemmataceae bacterium]
MNWISLCLTLLCGSDPDWRAYSPLVRHEAPSAAVGNPIDAFIQKSLIRKKLKPSPKASKEVLLRRLTFDLTGLPPTPEELKEFLADPAHAAFEKQVDRLLNSPRHGERMARLWMDAVHFAETHGHDQDRIRPNAWRYRDYLIQSFNSDLPYSRFIEEQIAVDVLYPAESNKLPALGFLAAGPWDESSLRDIREDSIDRDMGRYLDRDDMLTTVMGTFQGLTIQCARCHDHKFDPVTQEEYYNLQAVFSGMGRGEKEYNADPAVGRRRQALQTYLTMIEKGDPGVAADLQSPALTRELLAWEQSQVFVPVIWKAVTPTALVSEAGSILVKKGDAILASGPRPEKDTYTITFETPAAITAVRLQLLADPALPKGGPGRQDNGNLHLTEFSLGGKVAGSAAENFSLKPPSSDYDQPGWTVLHAVDGNPATAWGIYPQVGKDHEAVFPIKNPPTAGTKREWTIKLAQLHGSGHLIGQFRISVTEAINPVVSPLPPEVQTALAAPREKRSRQEWDKIGRHYLKLKTQKELDTLPPMEKVYAGVADFSPDGSHRPVDKPRQVFFLKRGDIRKPGKAAEPASLGLTKDIPASFHLNNNSTDAGRRSALARWLAAKDNPLTWRVMANRLWHFHFNKGFIATCNDLGLMGGQPSHPELLDWLAVRIRDSGSLKDLHRLIVTSAAYQQTSDHHPGNAAIDPDNRFLWRANRQRLDAEQVRDAILLASGRLDSRMGGASDMQFILRPGKHVTPMADYEKFLWDRPAGHRRSVYRFQFRTLPDPLVECLDGVDGSQPTPVRNQSFTPLQALALWNDDFILAHARAIADASSLPANEFLNDACVRLWGRKPTSQEAALFTSLAGSLPRPQLVRVLCNCNQFLFID